MCLCLCLIQRFANYVGSPDMKMESQENFQNLVRKMLYRKKEENISKERKLPCCHSMYKLQAIEWLFTNGSASLCLHCVSTSTQTIILSVCQRMFFNIQKKYKDDVISQKPCNVVNLKNLNLKGKLNQKVP